MRLWSLCTQNLLEEDLRKLNGGVIDGDIVGEEAGDEEGFEWSDGADLVKYSEDLIVSETDVQLKRTKEVDW